MQLLIIFLYIFNIHKGTEILSGGSKGSSNSQFVGSDHVTKAALPPSGRASHFHFEASDKSVSIFKRSNPQK